MTDADTGMTDDDTGMADADTGSAGEPLESNTPPVLVARC